MYYLFLVIVLSLLSFFSTLIHADDSLSALMDRTKTQSAVKITYQEIRRLEFMDQPWYGSGIMYSMPPNLLIKEQLQPTRVLMAIEGNNVFYLDANVQHQGEVDENDPLSLSVMVFKALMNGDEALLQRYYAIEFSTHLQRWLLSLKAKNSSSSGISIIISGLSGGQAELIKINQADGDVSEILLNEIDNSPKVMETVQRLYQELQGE